MDPQQLIWATSDRQASDVGRYAAGIEHLPRAGAVVLNPVDVIIDEDVYDVDVPTPAFCWWAEGEHYKPALGPMANFRDGQAALCELRSVSARVRGNGTVERLDIRYHWRRVRFEAGPTYEVFSELWENEAIVRFPDGHGACDIMRELAARLMPAAAELGRQCRQAAIAENKAVELAARSDRWASAGRELGRLAGLSEADQAELAAVFRRYGAGDESAAVPDRLADAVVAATKPSTNAVAAARSEFAKAIIELRKTQHRLGDSAIRLFFEANLQPLADLIGRRDAWPHERRVRRWAEWRNEFRANGRTKRHNNDADAPTSPPETDTPGRWEFPVDNASSDDDSPFAVLRKLKKM